LSLSKPRQPTKRAATSGIRTAKRNYICVQVNSVKSAFSRPTHLRLTQTVGDCRKSLSSKIIFEKWDRNAKRRLVFGVPHNNLATFRLFFSLLWEIFKNIFRTRGFSTVSLGS
jgi:nuclear transport factor 2 (NTF2) superfamily protein